MCSVGDSLCKSCSCRSTIVKVVVVVVLVVVLVVVRSVIMVVIVSCDAGGMVLMVV